MTTTIASVALTIIGLRLLTATLRQAFAHLVLRRIQHRLSLLPNDKTVVRSPGMKDDAYVIDPCMIHAFAESRGWFAVRLLSLIYRSHPVLVAPLLRRIPIAEASVFDVRMLATSLRRTWVDREDEELIGLLNLRSYDLRDFPDGEPSDSGESTAITPDTHA